MLHTGNRNAVTEGLVPGAVRSAGDVRPKIRKALEPLTFQWRQPSYQLADADGMHIVEGIPAACFGLERSAQIAVFNSVPAVQPGDFCFTHKIGSVLVLPSTLGADHLVSRVFIASLLGKDTMPVGCRNGIADVRLNADAVSAVLILPVDDVAGDAVGFNRSRIFTGVREKHRRLRDQRDVVPACSIAG